MKLWIDDERPTPAGYTHNALSSEQALSLLTQYRDGKIDSLEVISFDHDLGEVWKEGVLVDDTSRRVMLWMAEYDVWPLEIRIHTANPVGREWLEGTARQYAPDWVKIDAHDYDGRGFENYG